MIFPASTSLAAGDLLLLLYGFCLQEITFLQTHFPKATDHPAADLFVLKHLCVTFANVNVHGQKTGDWLLLSGHGKFDLLKLYGQAGCSGNVFLSLPDAHSHQFQSGLFSNLGKKPDAVLCLKKFHNHHKSRD